ncbi:glycosyltransferase [Alsobacter sp. KACC 23698]|uniref:Glycosyltransferase n=1 Tax=Alsobacter sp. KACC 23698 TaxID=3149229 RepID=A0AAU7JK69_9HYPH
MKLVVLTNDFPYFVAHRLHVAQAAANAGWTVTVIGPQSQPIPPELAACGFDISVLPLVRSKLDPAADLNYVRGLVAALGRIRPDVVHAITIKPVLLGGMALQAARLALGRRFGFVATIPGLGLVFSTSAGASRLGRLRRLAVEALYRAALAYPGVRVTFETQSDRAFFMERFGLPADRAILLAGTGVDLSRFVPGRPPAAPMRVLFAGRLLHSKGVDTFCEAARLARSQGLNVEWLIAGWRDGGSADALSEDDIEALRRSSDVTFLGHVADMPALLAGVHVLALPTRYPEGVPRILIEAAACGVAIVVPDFPGARRLVDHEVSGLLIDDDAGAPAGGPTPAAVSLAQAIARLAGDPGLRARLAAAAQRRVLRDGYGAPEIQTRFLEIFADSAGRPAPSAAGGVAHPARALDVAAPAERS